MIIHMMRCGWWQPWDPTNLNCKPVLKIWQYYIGNVLKWDNNTKYKTMQLKFAFLNIKCKLKVVDPILGPI